MASKARRSILAVAGALLLSGVGGGAFFWHRSHTPEGYMARADAALGQFRFREAVPLLREVVRREPRNAKAHALLAATLLQVNDRLASQSVRLPDGKVEKTENLQAYPAPAIALAEAAAQYQEAIRLWPSNPFYYRSLAGVFSEQKRYDAAILEYHRALYVFPKTKAAPVPGTSVQDRYVYNNYQQLSAIHEGLADCYASLHEYSRALSETKAAVSYGYDEPYRHNDLGDYYLATGQPQQAHAEWLKASTMARARNDDNTMKEVDQKIASLPVGYRIAPSDGDHASPTHSRSIN